VYYRKVKSNFFADCSVFISHFKRIPK